MFYLYIACFLSTFCVLSFQYIYIHVCVISIIILDVLYIGMSQFPIFVFINSACINYKMDIIIERNHLNFYR